MKIGTAEALKSAVVRGSLVLGEYPDGTEICAPIAIATGTRPGPTMWLQACVHGPELVGPLAISRFLGELDLQRFSGTVVCLLAANPIAFRSRDRLTIVDGQNLNRSYPGQTDGGVTQRMAHVALTAALEVSDALVDLHSGGDHLVCSYHIIYRNDGGAAGKKSEEMASGLGAPQICNAMSPVFDGAAFACFVASGRPAVLVESGGGATVTQVDIENQVRAIRGACSCLGMLPAAPAAPPPQIGREVALIHGERGGIFEPMAPLEAVLDKGDEFGRIRNLYGDTLEICRNPFGRARLIALRRAYMPIHAGEEVAEISHIG